MALQAPARRATAPFIQLLQSLMAPKGDHCMNFHYSLVYLRDKQTVCCCSFRFLQRAHCSPPACS